MKRCKHHPNYEPDSGRPNPGIPGEFASAKTEECPSCWIAYATWMEDEGHRRLTILHERYLDNIADHRRMNAIIGELLVLYPPTPSDDEFDGKWIVCDYCLPNWQDNIAADKDLRKAIDKAAGLKPKTH